jgi:hypothetical protein
VKLWRLYALMLLCTACISLAIAWTWADYQSLRADYIVASWQRGEPVTEPEWQHAKDLQASALFWRGQQPDYLEAMAQLYYWRNTQTDISAAELDQNFEASLRYYRLAIVQRPLWPYAWANVALIKAQMRLWDAEFYTALLRAQQLGPWETRVQLAVHEAGLISWRQLDFKNRELLLQNFSNSFFASQRQVKKMLALTEKYSYKAAFCFYARQQPAESSVAAIIERSCG